MVEVEVVGMVVLLRVSSGGDGGGSGVMVEVMGKVVMGW